MKALLETIKTRGIMHRMVLSKADEAVFVGCSNIIQSTYATFMVGAEDHLSSVRKAKFISQIKAPISMPQRPNRIEERMAHRHHYFVCISPMSCHSARVDFLDFSATYAELFE